MNNYQKDLIRMFGVLDSEFKKINFKWYPFAGTLLGTIRHHGIIPWDDDIDMMSKHFDIVENIEEIKNICEKNNFKIRCYIDNIDTDVIRIYSDKESKVEFEGMEIVNRAFIEIHPLKSVREDDDYNKISFYGQWSSVSNIPISKYKQKLPLKKSFNLNMRIAKIIGTILIPRKAFRNKITKRLNMEDEGTIFTTIYNFSKNNHYPFDFSKTEIKQFNGIDIEVPLNWHRYLVQKYGCDYMVNLDKDYFPKHLLNGGGIR